MEASECTATTWYLSHSPGKKSENPHLKLPSGNLVQFVIATGHRKFVDETGDFAPERISVEKYQESMRFPIKQRCSGELSSKPIPGISGNQKPLKSSTSNSMVEIQHSPHFGFVCHLILVQDPWLLAAPSKKRHMAVAMLHQSKLLFCSTTTGDII